MGSLGIMLFMALLTVMMSPPRSCQAVPMNDTDTDNALRLSKPMDMFGLASLTLTFTFSNGTTSSHLVKLNRRCLGPVVDITRGFFGSLQTTCGNPAFIEPEPYHVLVQLDQNHEWTKIMIYVAGGMLIGYFILALIYGYQLKKQKNDFKASIVESKI